MAIVKSTAPALEKHGLAITTAMYARLFENEEIEAMFEVCRSHWPVMPTAPSEEMKHVRRLMAGTGAWPYGSVDQPLDWCWGATGLGA